MLKIHSYDVPGLITWQIVVHGMRNSWESHEKSDSYVNHTYDGSFFIFGDSDKELAKRLIKSGADHSKFMRQLPVVMSMTAPSFFWWDHDTYKVGTTRNSTSSMHTLGKVKLDESHFSMEDVPESIRVQLINTTNDLIDSWVANGKKKGPNAKEWRAMIEVLPRGFNFTSTWSANYQVLRNIYLARRGHRLLEWRQFCEWIELLPHSDLITHSCVN